MPASKAQQKATNKWIAKAYDRINLTVPKGKKDTLQEHAQSMGESVNGFINRAIDNQISRDRDKDQMAGESTGGALHREEKTQEMPLGAATAKEE